MFGTGYKTIYTNTMDELGITEGVMSMSEFADWYELVTGRYDEYRTACLQLDELGVAAPGYSAAHPDHGSAAFIRESISGGYGFKAVVSVATDHWGWDAVKTFLAGKKEVVADSGRLSWALEVMPDWSDWCKFYDHVTIGGPQVQAKLARLYFKDQGLASPPNHTSLVRTLNRMGVKVLNPDGTLSARNKREE